MKTSLTNSISVLILFFGLMGPLPYLIYSSTLQYFQNLKKDQKPAYLKNLELANQQFLDQLKTQYNLSPNEVEYEIYSDIQQSWFLPEPYEQVSNRIAQNEILDDDRFIRKYTQSPSVVKELQFKDGMAIQGNYMVFKVLSGPANSQMVDHVAYYRLCPHTGSRQFQYDGETITELRGMNRYDVYTGQGITTNKHLIRVNIERKRSGTVLKENKPEEKP